MENKQEAILETAEKMIRDGGYRAFSFREIAKVIGIKSSSVHYYFPTKADLGAEVAKRYTERFLNRIGDSEQLIQQGKDPIENYVNVFREALVKDKSMCLCGLLGAEANSLPSEVVQATKLFFERNIEWLTQAYTLKSGQNAPHAQAVKTLALLEGTMMISNALGNTKIFDNVVKEI